MVSETELLRLALMAYETATEPELWPQFLKRYTEAVDADFSVLQIHDVRQHKSSVLSEFGLSVPFTKSYNEYYSRLNVWRERGRAFLRAGRVNIGEEMCPRELLERSEFYNEYMLRIGGRYSMGTVFAQEARGAPTLSVQRRSLPFTEPEREVSRFLLPHLSRAWTVQQRLELLSASEAVMDTLPLGIVFLASNGAAVYWNRTADEILRTEDGLSLRENSLVAIDRNANAQLRRAVNSALSPSAAPVHSAVAVPRKSARRAYQIVAAPLLSPPHPLAGAPKPAAVALITDPERQKPAPQDLLTQIYKLTRKEAMLAAKLAEGQSLRTAAEELRITYETARTHLRSIFGKTGTSRQSELILLIDQLPASGS